MSFNAPPHAAAHSPLVGGWLFTKTSNYLVQSIVGQGSFGKVAKCVRMKDMQTVAIKLFENKTAVNWEANIEVSNLLKLKSLDPDKSNIVRWYRSFTDRGHTCLEFEHLDRSLFDFLRERRFRPLLLKEIRPVVQQLANALDHLRALGIIHTDIKLDNVMLVNHAVEPFKVKVIDFGLACEAKDTQMDSYIQTRPYRAPEVLLGAPFTEATDMWSLGCLVAALHLGVLLYPGASEYDMVRFIVETQGQPPDHVLNSGHLTDIYFQRSRSRLWRLKTPEQFYQETGIESKETRMIRLNSLDDILQIWVVKHENCDDSIAEINDLRMFVNMLKSMMNLDAAERITPRQLLEHHFISMHHIGGMFKLSSHVRSCFSMMNVCQRSSGLRQPRHINPHPPSSPVRSGMKRKHDDEDWSMPETSHVLKKLRIGCDRKSYAGPSTCKSGRDLTHKVQASAAVSLAQPHHHGINSHHPKISLTQTYTRVKRKRADGQDGGHLQANSDHYERSHDDRKRFRRSYEGPSIPQRSSWTQSGVSERVKRKRSPSDDSYYYKRSVHPRRCYAGEASDSNRNFSTHALRVQPDRWSNPAEHHRHSTHPAVSTPTETHAWSGLKRRAADDDDDGAAWPRHRASDLRSDHEGMSNVGCFQERKRRRLEPHMNDRLTCRQRHYQRARGRYDYSGSTAACSRF